MKIFCFIDYYIPGFKAGGPLRTISNIVDHLGEQIKFYIITRDHDYGSSETYKNVLMGKWNEVGHSSVLYLPVKQLGFIGIYSLLNKNSYDVIYLNSFFSVRLTLIPLLICKFNLCQKKLILLAPRGEFSEGALKIKSFKKKIYIYLINKFNICNDIFWQASSKYELIDIQREMNVIEQNIYIAPDLLPALKFSSPIDDSNFIVREHGCLRIIFLSRISVKKNLNFLLDVLTRVGGSVSCSIFGPIEDVGYWNECVGIINSMPRNIKVQYLGPIEPEQVNHIFSQHDLFVFPTLGENFGHVIFESLSSGTPVLLSDQTPWVADSCGALEIISVQDKNSWIEAIDRWAQFNNDDLIKFRRKARNYALNYLKNDNSINLNKDMFYSISKS